MKKLLLVLAIVFMAMACSLDEDRKNDFELAFIPVDSVDMPQAVVPGRTYPVTMYFRRPNDCYYVSQEPFYEINGNIRTVAVQALVIEDANCQSLTDAPADVKVFNFQCPLTTDRSFTFKFYKGNDTYGNQDFLEFTVPVQQ